LQANRKALEGKQHPDRDAQFQYISRRAMAFQRADQPVISVDTKKKEPLGKMKNPGRTYRRKGDPEKVTTHDFPDKKRGKAVPYGVYDLTYDEAGVSVGVSHDTAEFAVAAIRRWWQRLGRKRYPRATRLLITADSGGSNSPRTRLWRWALQQFAMRPESTSNFATIHLAPASGTRSSIGSSAISLVTGKESHWKLSKSSLT
jgi:Rhodopirellula transposase DDE domain